MPMTSSDYRAQAEQRRVEAERAQGSEQHKWLQLHRAWLDLADHNEQQPASSQKRKAAEPGKSSH
jgi:hypothetical protein